MILAVTAVLAFPVSLVSAGIARAVADRELVMTLFREHLVESDQVYRLFLQGMSLSDGRGDGETSSGPLQLILENFEQAEHLRIVKILVPEEWIAGEVEANLNEFYAWIQNQADYPRFAFQTRALSDGLTREKAERIADGIILSWPECSPDLILQIQTGELSPGEILDYRCSPPGEIPRDILVDTAAGSIIALFRSLPDEVVLIEPVDEIQRAEINSARSSLNRILSLMAVLWLFPVFLLGLVMAIQIRSWRSLGLWWGIPLFISGMLTLPGGLFIGNMGRVFLGIIQRYTEIPLQLVQILKPLFHDLLVSSRPLVLFLALSLITAGGILMVFTVIRPWSGKMKRTEDSEKISIESSVLSEPSQVDSSLLQDDGQTREDQNPCGMFG